MNATDPDAPRAPKAGILLELEPGRGWHLSWDTEDAREEGFGLFAREDAAMKRVHAVDAKLSSRGYDVEFRKQI